METKIRRESETLMEKVFNKYAKRGSGGRVRTEKVPEMMKHLRGDDWDFTEDELYGQISNEDRNGTGTIGMDEFNRIAIHFLMKQARRDSDSFIHKHTIFLEDLGQVRPPPPKKTFTIAQRQKYEMDPFTFKHEIACEDFAPTCPPQMGEI